MSEPKHYGNADEDIYTDICPICGKEIRWHEVISGIKYFRDMPVMLLTCDCHGIPFRMVCVECHDKIMETKGYDGEYYTELDECIDYDY